MKQLQEKDIVYSYTYNYNSVNYNTGVVTRVTPKQAVIRRVGGGADQKAKRLPNSQGVYCAIGEHNPHYMIMTPEAEVRIKEWKELKEIQKWYSDNKCKFTNDQIREFYDTQHKDSEVDDQKVYECSYKAVGRAGSAAIFLKSESKPTSEDVEGAVEARTDHEFKLVIEVIEINIHII